MPKISAEEKETATLIPLERILSDIDDTESAFNEFRESFHTGDEPGVVRAWELMIDDRGNVGTTKMQTKLGSWPIDAYRLDELCQLIVDQYMSPDQTRMAVRLVGTDPKKTGYVFNKIMMLKRAHKKESSSNGSESTASLLKIVQENNERVIGMMQRMQAPVEKPDVMAEIQKMMAFSQAMNAPMMAMLQSLLPALAGRPAAAGGDPFAGMTGLLDVVERVSEMRGGEGGGGDENSLVGILKAIAPLAKPALEALPAIAAMNAARAPAPARLVAPAGPRPPPPGSVPTAAPVPASVPTPTPAARPAPVAPIIHPTDIPSGDSQMLAQLKPQIDSLVQMAEAGSDPIGAADLIFDQVFLDPNLPDEIFEKLAGFVDSQTFVNYVIVMNPLARPHSAWFETFKTQIVKRLVDETETIDTPTPQPPATS
jgi:hypothetical protein